MPALPKTPRKGAGAYPRGGRPVTPQATVDAILAAARAGKTRNAIVRELGVSAYVVSKVAQANGVTFDRAATSAATAAKVADFKAQRATLNQAMIDKAHQLLALIDEPFKAYSFGGKDNVYTEHWQDRMPPGDMRSLMQAANYALNGHLAIEAKDGDQGVEGAKSVLGALAAGIDAAARELETNPPPVDE